MAPVDLSEAERSALEALLTARSSPWPVVVDGDRASMRSLEEKGFAKRVLSSVVDGWRITEAGGWEHSRYGFRCVLEYKKRWHQEQALVISELTPGECDWLVNMDGLDEVYLCPYGLDSLVKKGLVARFYRHGKLMGYLTDAGIDARHALQVARRKERADKSTQRGEENG